MIGHGPEQRVYTKFAAHAKMSSTHTITYE
jgi:hypothetical protein